MQQKLVDQQKSLTCDKDTAVSTIAYCKQPNMFRALNPFVDQTPTAILTRQFKIAEFAIPDSFSFQQFVFPQELFKIPSIQNALSSFFYFRSDVEVSIKINSTPYHQGMMLVSFLHDNVNDVPYSTLQRSALNPVVLNYSSSDSVTLQFGWLHPEVYMGLVQPIENITGAFIGSLRLDPIFPTDNTSGGPAIVYATIYARFLNPRVAGFNPEAPAVMGQSANAFKFAYAPETEDKSKSLMPTSTEQDSLLSPLFKSIPLIEGTVSNVVDLFSHLTKILDKTQDVASPQRMQYGLGSDNITGSGQILADRLTLYPTSRLATFPIAPECHTSQMPVVQIAQQPMLWDTYVFTHITNEISNPCSPFCSGNNGIYKSGTKSCRNTRLSMLNGGNAQILERRNKIFVVFCD